MPFTAVTAHFIPEDCPKLVSTTLSCTSLTGSHTSERLAEQLTAVMKKFGIEKTAVSVTTDTASNIKKCVNQLLPNQEWIACVCHVLQLCALKILEEPSVKRTLAKHNRVTTHLHHSTSALEKMTKLQEVN